MRRAQENTPERSWETTAFCCRLSGEEVELGAGGQRWTMGLSSSQKARVPPLFHTAGWQPCPHPDRDPRLIPATKLDTGVRGDGYSLHGEGPPDLFSGSSTTQIILMRIKTCKNPLKEEKEPEKTMIWKDAGTPSMFTAALFTTAKTRKQPKCPRTEEWVKKTSYTYTIEY